LPRDANKNVVVGEHLGIDTSSSLIYGSERLIATVGVQGIVIVDTGDALLVCAKDRAQDVKHIVELLKQKKEKFL
jgi:mannose-1-phosphate guanylyltransferase